MHRSGNVTFQLYTTTTGQKVPDSPNPLQLAQQMYCMQNYRVHAKSVTCKTDPELFLSSAIYNRTFFHSAALSNEVLWGPK